eukprot:509623-Rhodomonas_salina.5
MLPVVQCYLSCNATWSCDDPVPPGEELGHHILGPPHAGSVPCGRDTFGTAIRDTFGTAVRHLGTAHCCIGRDPAYAIAGHCCIGRVGRYLRELMIPPLTSTRRDLSWKEHTLGQFQASRTTRVGRSRSSPGLSGGFTSTARKFFPGVRFLLTSKARRRNIPRFWSTGTWLPLRKSENE